MNYEIIISISLGDNFPLQEEFLSKSCKTTAILEAKFNEEVLQSDPILINSVNPELATELGFRLNKKDFQQFRIERKSIKLQCFVDYSTLTERHFIGYVVLQIRDIQEYTHDPKYKWHVLLNPKYKGSSMKRPQLHLAFMVNKLKDEEMVSSQSSLSLSESHHEYLESQFIRPLKREAQPAMSSSVHFPLSSSSSSANNVDEYDSNLKVKLKSKTFYIWDENKCSESDCAQMYLIQIQIDKPRNLSHLLGGQKTRVSLGEEVAEREVGYHFKYTLLGRQIKTNDFFDINCADFRKHKFLFPILTYDKNMLREYFESYPTIEIRFCLCSPSTIVGFVTINLLRLFENNFATIEGDYMIVPEDESVYVKEPFPVVQLSMSISRMDHSQVIKKKKKAVANTRQFKSPESQEGEEAAEDTATTASGDTVGSEHSSSSINHYYIAMDLRTIKLHTNIDGTANCQILFQPFYLQFSYAFFGISDYIKTYPSIQFDPDHPQNAITIPHGFCGFNFATTQEKLKYTFSNIPFIVQLILEKDDTLLGTAELDLSCLLQQKHSSSVDDDLGGDNFVNTCVHVQDELNDQICEMQVVMFLQEIQNLTHFPESRPEVHPNAIVPADSDELRKKELMNSLNDMIIETAHDIELWKEEQMKIFKNKLKQKEAEFMSNLSSAADARAKEEQLKVMEENVREREELLARKEAQIEARQKELDAKFYKLGQEIDEAIHEVRIQYEEKTLLHRNQIKALEQDKYSCQERVYLLERKVKERDLKIKELEGKLINLGQTAQRRAQSAQRATSLTRNVSATSSNNARRIVITRDTQPMSKSMVDSKSNREVNRIGSPSPRTTTAKPPPPLKPKVISLPTGKGNEPFVIEKIKRERQELIKKGVSVVDPLICEIDKRIKSYRPVSMKRI